MPGFNALVILFAIASSALAGSVKVPAGRSIQAAIDAARDGDVVHVAAGVFIGDIDFKGKAITVMGVGPDSVVRGTGSGPVVRFASGESRESTLESVTVTGGLADQGGGVFVLNSSPTVRRVVIAHNAARHQGSGVYLEGSSALLSNNLVAYNRTADPPLGDAHSIQLVDSTAVLVNNTVAYGDSNGLLVRGGGRSVIMNNIFARNGSRVEGAVRGRGICDFSGGAVIQYNLFYRNRRAALLSGSGRDYARVRNAERDIDEPRLAFNLDGAPAFADARRGNFVVLDDGRARGMGNPDPAFRNPDGSRNHLGYTGGPLAPTWSARELRAVASRRLPRGIRSSKR